MPRKRRRKAESLEIVNPDCAGIDIGKDSHYVAVDPDRCAEPVRSFDAFTPDLEGMAAWLSSCGVEKVAMESTSVYWIPVYEVLDRAGFEVLLVPPRMTKQISGRKSDVLDCQWIRQLLSYGLLRGAFRPDDDAYPPRSSKRRAHHHAHYLFVIGFGRSTLPRHNATRKHNDPVGRGKDIRQVVRN